MTSAHLAAAASPHLFLGETFRSLAYARSMPLTPDEFKRRIAIARRFAGAARGGRLTYSQVGGGSGQILLKLPDGSTFYFGGAVTDDNAQLLVHCTNLVLDHLSTDRIDGADEPRDRA
jgi:hypothetical protein